MSIHRLVLVSLEDGALLDASEADASEEEEGERAAQRAQAQAAPPYVSLNDAVKVRLLSSVLSVAVKAG